MEELVELLNKLVVDIEKIKKLLEDKKLLPKEEKKKDTFHT